jgi:hypothetical protein
MIHQMTAARDILHTRLYRLAELVELARQLPPEERARTQRMIVQARQAVREARGNEQQEQARPTTTRAIVLRLLVKGAYPKTELRIMDDRIRR